VYVSAFELYRIGPGPSSTYTVGPQRAALRFVHDLAADGVLPTIHRVEVELYGGLAFHGREHATPGAIVAGLSGQSPERCDGAALTLCHQRAETESALSLAGKHRVRFEPGRDLKQVINHSLAYDGNAVRFLARNLRGEVIASRLYFSTGGGTVMTEGDSADGAWMPRVPYPFSSAESLLDACRAHGKRICDLMRANECTLFSPAEVRAGLLLFAQTMRGAVERGLTADGTLPGGRRRTAASWNDASRESGAMPAQLCAVYATAIGEENAVGGKVVAAPSAGSAGPVAALMQLWRDSAPMQHDERAADFLLAGAAVGGLLRAAGLRQVGCQGEIGVAAAMAAAGYAAVHNASNSQILYAAERALEPHLGLGCDLIAGRIEDPCIERGAMAASRAYNAAVAAVRMPNPRVGLDALSRSVIESGRAMAGRYKAASIGGVAINVVEC
jgi:L-serine dehydratase